MRNYDYEISNALEQFLFYGEVDEIRVLDGDGKNLKVKAYVCGKPMIFRIGSEDFMYMQDHYDIGVTYDVRYNEYAA